MAGESMNPQCDGAGAIVCRLAARLDLAPAPDNAAAHAFPSTPRSPFGSTNVNQVEVFSAADRGDYPEAERQYRRTLAIRKQLGDRAGVATGYGQLGLLAQARGDYPDTERQFHRALAIREELGDRARMATSFHNLGVLAQLRGDYPEAERQNSRALGIRERLGDRAGLADSYAQLGTLAALRGEYPEAGTAVLLRAGYQGGAGRPDRNGQNLPQS
jgi:tetratricopeptide (TPR) repeat protein